MKTCLIQLLLQIDIWCKWGGDLITLRHQDVAEEKHLNIVK